MNSRIDMVHKSSHIKHLQQKSQYFSTWWRPLINTTVSVYAFGKIIKNSGVLDTFNILYNNSSTIWEKVAKVDKIFEICLFSDVLTFTANTLFTTFWISWSKRLAHRKKWWGPFPTPFQNDNAVTLRKAASPNRISILTMKMPVMYL